jgi:putative transcriptional regulator
MKSNLKERRIHGGWKQSEFAKKIGVSVSHLSLLEKDKRTPSLALAFKIAETFGIWVEAIWSE